MDPDPQHQSGDLQDPAEPKRVDVSQDVTQEPSQPVETEQEVTQQTTTTQVTEETPNLGGGEQVTEGEDLVEGRRNDDLPTETAPETQDNES